MKIVIIIDSLARGGAEKQAVLSAIALRRLGQEVELISCNEANDFKILIERNAIPVHVVTNGWPLKVGRVASLTRLLRRAACDVVHCFKSGTSSYGRVAATLAGVHQIFGGVRDEMRDRLLLRVLHRVVNIWTSKWIVNSRGCKKKLINQFRVEPENIFVVPNGIDLEDFQSNLTVEQAKIKFGFDRNVPVVSILANLRPEKNHKMFLRVAKKLLDSSVAATFVVAGDGPLREELAETCQSMGISDSIRFLGRCDEVADLLRATDIVAMTSLHESLPNALIEAGAMGVPCVSTDCGSVAEIILDGLNGFVVRKNDDDGMVESIMSLISNPDLRLRMGQEARKQVAAKYALDILGNNLLEVYKGERISVRDE
jgi:glycosyltransferase involved in cell wall biosynthesis